MSTAELTIEHEPKQKPEIVRFLEQRAIIAGLERQYMPLKIAGLDDKTGLKAVHEARMEVKGLRVKIEKRRKELKADALEYGKAVDSAARELTNLIEPIEEHLEAEEKKITDEKDRLRREAEEKHRLMVEDRCRQLTACGVTPNPIEVAKLTPGEWETALAEAQSIKAEREAAEQERQRLAAEEAARRKAEAEKLAAERAELEKQRKAQQEEADRLKAEREKMEAQQREQQRQAELQKAREEAAEKSRIETEQRLKAEAEQKAKDEEARVIREKLEAEREAARKKEAAEAQARREQQQREEAEAARLKAEAERPLREKYLAIADAVKAIAIPSEGPGAVEVAKILLDAETAIRAIAKRRSLSKA